MYRNFFEGTVTGRISARDPAFQHPYGEARRDVLRGELGMMYGYTVHHEIPRDAGRGWTMYEAAARTEVDPRVVGHIAQAEGRILRQGQRREQPIQIHAVELMERFREIHAERLAALGISPELLRGE